MKKRSIWKMFVLTILTLGMYRLYWFVKTRREMMNLNPTVKIMSPLFLFIPVILVVVAVGAFIFSSVRTVANQPSYCRTTAYQSGSSFDYGSRPVPPPECRSGAPAWGIGLIYASILVFYPLIVIWLWGYSKGVEVITGGHTSFAIALIILLLVPDGIDILIIQDSFNKLVDVPPTANPGGGPSPIAA